MKKYIVINELFWDCLIKNHVLSQFEVEMFQVSINLLLVVKLMRTLSLGCPRAVTLPAASPLAESLPEGKQNVINACSTMVAGNLNCPQN